MSQQQTLTDFGLQRRVLQNKIPSWFSFLEGKADPVNMVRNGQSYCIESDHHRSSSSILGGGNDHRNLVYFSYTKAVSERTLVVDSAFLQEPQGTTTVDDTNSNNNDNTNTTTPTRYTDMRAWQMIVDSWLTDQPEGTQSAGAASGLRYLAVHNVMETQSLTAMENEMERQWSSGAVERRSDSPPVSVAYTAASSPENWLTNPWIRCAQRVAEGLSTPALRVTVARAWVILDGGEEYHLVVEFASASVEGAQSS